MSGLYNVAPYVNSIIATNIKSTSVDIDYTLVDNSGGTFTFFLYKFIGNTVPRALTSDGVLITTVVLTNGQTIMDTYTDSNFTGDELVYSYAFYDGNTVDTSYVIKDLMGNALFVTAFHYAAVSNFSLMSIDYTSCALIFSLYNTTSKDLSFNLFRFNLNEAPLVNPTSGTLVVNNPFVAVFNNPILPATVAKDSKMENIMFFDPMLTKNNIYSYAFYDGIDENANIIRVSNNFSINNRVLTQYNNQIITNNYINSVSTLTAEYVTSISIAEKSDTTIVLNFNIVNPLSMPVKPYLYKFAGKTFPIMDPTVGSRIMVGTVGPNSSLASQFMYICDLSSNTYYTFAFYTGGTNIDTVLTNRVGYPQTITMLTDVENAGAMNQKEINFKNKKMFLCFT